MTRNQEREQWASKLGFVLAASGSAVGLANIWAFPYRTGQNGGAAFVLIYLICIFLVCLPFMFAELTLGRFGQKNVVGAIRALKAGRGWLLLGGMCLVASVWIVSFYSVVAGWSLGFIFKMLVGNNTSFPQFVSNPLAVLGLFVGFICLNIFVVLKGVQHGIERWSKILMPILLGLLVCLILYGLTLPGAAEGLEFFLKPDFSKIDGNSVMSAVGQAFFSLSLGIGGILTYGSYLSKKENIIAAGTQVVVLDSVIAILAGLVIFPALFSFGQQPDEGPALVFVVLPAIFEQLPLGNLLGAGFFLLLTIAALTSTISMLEISIAYFVDEKRFTRKRAVRVIGLVAIVFGLPSALSQGAVPALTQLSFFGGQSFLELMIFLWFDIFPPLGAVCFSILIGWVWGIDNASAELQQGVPGFDKPVLGLVSKAKIWGVFVRYVCPLAIMLVWFNAVC